ncbi:DUF6270 domain-containing protein [Glutamicibacter ardleyensis]|uniref:DUF6270 domain-containing protein n=1 Tax=Glutamicibacter ardleyensis TaxID=225894 RepID=UPI003FCF6B1A
MSLDSQKYAMIYGSCVSRDLVRIDSERFAPGHYTARQSWISGVSLPSRPPEIKLASAFQKRMVEDDYRSSARTIMTSTRPSRSDLIILDLIDERVGVFENDEGHITYSNELKKSKAISEDQLNELIAFGSDHHFNLWAEAASELRELLAPHISKVRLIAAKFAETMVDGSRLKPFRDIEAQDWNRLYERYYAYADNLGFSLIEHDPKFAISTSDHKWGATPFHYVDEAYLDFGTKILSSLK